MGTLRVGWNPLEFLEESQQLWRSGATNYFSDLANASDMLNYSPSLWPPSCASQSPSITGRTRPSGGSSTVGLLGIDYGARQMALRYIQFLYGWSSKLLCGRMINMLKVDRGVGVLIIMLGNMVPEITMWFVLALCITLGFALFAVVLPGDVVYGDQIGWPSWMPFWGLLGEFDLDVVSTYALLTANDLASTVVPFLLWVYCFIATVILVNLLIAQMSSIYEQERSSEF